MSTELICPTHGPYSASYGSCPFCSGNRPQAPSPLGAGFDEDMPTDIGGGGWSGDEAPTDFGSGASTDFGHKTDIGRGGRDDETELDWNVAVDEGPLALLWIKNGRRRGKTYTIKDGDKVGRTKGEIILDDPKVSNPHARFRLEDDVFTLWDFGSKNGTHVNGERIKAATELKENDEIKFGDTIYVFKILE